MHITYQSMSLKKYAETGDKRIFSGLDSDRLLHQLNFIQAMDYFDPKIMDLPNWCLTELEDGWWSVATNEKYSLLFKYEANVVLLDMAIKPKLELVHDQKNASERS